MEKHPVALIPIATYDQAADERHWGAITGIAGGRDDSGDGRGALDRHCEGASGLV